MQGENGDRQALARHRQALSRQLATLVKEQAVYLEASSGLDPAWEAASLEVLRREKW